FARPSTLEGRLLAVLDPQRDRRAVGQRAARLATLLAALLLFPMAALKPVAASVVRGHWKGKNERAAADPDALRPSRVTRVPDPARPLVERVAWARADAARSRDGVWWIGWSMDLASQLQGSMLSDSRGMSLELLGRRGAFTLEDVLAGRTQGTNPQSQNPSESKPAAVLLRMTADGLDRVRVQSPELPVEFWGEPFYWLDAVPDEQTFAWLCDAANRARDDEMRGQLVETVSYMRNSALVVPYLTATFRGSGSPRVRANAAEGLGHHPSPEGTR